MAKLLKPGVRKVILGKYSQNLFLCPKCELPLWELLSGDVAKIIGQQEQDFEIGFIYLKAKCRVCGTLSVYNSKLHSIPTQTIANPYATISKFDSKKLLQCFGKNQRNIFMALVKKSSAEITDDLIEDISAQTDLPRKIVSKDLDMIQKIVTELGLL